MLGAALAVAPYFVHQTGFAVRCEPIAAAFAIFGLALLVPVEKQAESVAREVVAAAFFMCAFMTKITCVYAPAAAVVALFLAGRRLSAVRLAAVTALAAVGGVVLVNMASGGRALESFRACALAGSGVSSLLSPVAIWRPLQLIATSHLLTAVFLLAAMSLVVALRRRMFLPAL